MAILYKEYQDILGINPKYMNAITNLGPKANDVFRAIINLCADDIINEPTDCFSMKKNTDKQFYSTPFTSNKVVYYGNIPAAGATMSKLVSFGLLLKADKKNNVYTYCVPNDIFMTNDLSIKFYNPNIPQF